MTEESHVGDLFATADQKQEISDVHRETLPLVVTEEEALARARNQPDEALPLRITFGPQDRDNPRCWGYWRKWYITLFASFLNVITYVY